MNPAAPHVRNRRRIWPWLLGLGLTPFVVIGAMAVSVFVPDRDFTVLRKHVQGTTHADWHTKVQLNAGRLILGAVRTGLSLVDNPDIAEARSALKAVRRASVGVYERDTNLTTVWPHEQSFADTDKAMARRGWCRLVGVRENKETVMIYVPAGQDAIGSIDVCVSVVNDRELVVVSATVDAAGLLELVEKHAGGELKRDLKLVKL